MTSGHERGTDSPTGSVMVMMMMMLLMNEDDQRGGGCKGHGVGREEGCLALLLLSCRSDAVAKHGVETCIRLRQRATACLGSRAT
jgi:hypothetical protein